MRVISIVGGVLFLALTTLLFLSLWGPENPPEPIQTLPEFHLKSLDEGTPLRGQDLMKGTVLLTVFATWCVPCAMEHPQLMALAKEKDLKLYGIALKDDVQRLKAFLGDHGNPFVKIGLSPDGTVGVELGISGTPETFLVHQGHIVRRFKSALIDQDCRDIRAFLKQVNGG